MPKMHTRYYLMDFHSAKGGQIAQGLGAAGSSYLLCQPSPAPARCQTPTDKPARSADAAPRGDPDAGQWPLLDAGHPAGRRGRAPQRHHLLDEVAVVQLESVEFLSVSKLYTHLLRCTGVYTHIRREIWQIFASERASATKSLKRISCFGINILYLYKPASVQFCRFKGQLGSPAKIPPWKIITANPMNRPTNIPELL